MLTRTLQDSREAAMREKEMLVSNVQALRGTVTQQADALINLRQQTSVRRETEMRGKKRHGEWENDTARHKETQRDTERQRETQRDTARHRETQRDT